MLDRRTLLTAGTCSLTAAALSPASRSAVLHRTGPAARAGAGDVARIRQMTGLFQQMDDRHGGGHARNVVAAYLTQEVAPLLRGTTGAARPDLFTAAAELAYLLGWMASDDLRTGLSQRYYIQAFRLAEEADDPVKCATVLRSLSVQAVELGRGRQGLELAEAAGSMLGTRAPLRTRAWVTGMRAEAVAAADQDHGRARRLLAEAESHLERADSRPRDEWTGDYQRSSYEHQIGLTLGELGNWSRAEKHFQASMDTRDPAERRSLTLVGVRLAHAQLRQRRPEQAARTLLDLRENLVGVSSGRIRNHLKDIHASWRPYRTEEKVGEADELLLDILQPAKNR
ncbi:hypothetical protein [Actinocorallia populi]|uniref:hypothetical protein n=1 Tax=Actinocorallia populi TaxID=2079200 RepID=UPI0013002C19|nr:hypothetical protein [Actinocorallia populi]